MKLGKGGVREMGVALGGSCLRRNDGEGAQE